VIISFSEGVDSDSDGLMDVFEDGNLSANTGTQVLDSDGDTVLDFKDIDSDNDGIVDIVEARATADYIDATGVDADSDGVQDVFDTPTENGLGGQFDTPEDTDSDGAFDYLDTDSDGDFVSDIQESGLNGAGGDDRDRDGLSDDVFSQGTNVDSSAGIADPLMDLANTTTPVTDVDFRVIQDSDGDGILDAIDLDDDNDGILDEIEDASLAQADSLAANGNFNENYVDESNPGTPYTAPAINTAPAPWGKVSTPDLSTEDEVAFFNDFKDRANLPGFDAPPSGGSFMGFRGAEGLYTPIQVGDASEPITISFDYTEYDSRTDEGDATPFALLDLLEHGKSVLTPLHQLIFLLVHQITRRCIYLLVQLVLGYQVHLVL